MDHPLDEFEEWLEVEEQRERAEEALEAVDREREMEGREWAGADVSR